MPRSDLGWAESPRHRWCLSSRGHRWLCKTERSFTFSARTETKTLLTSLTFHIPLGFNPLLSQSRWLIPVCVCRRIRARQVPHSESPTWSSVAPPCSSGDRRGAAGRAAPACPQQKHSAAPAAAHSSPPGLQKQAHPAREQQRKRQRVYSLHHVPF